MWTPRSLLALPLALAATLGTANAASVRDRAGLFSPDAVRQAEAELNRVERDNQLNATVETVDSLEGNEIGDVTREHASRSGTHGLYVLIAKKENKIDVRASRQYSRAINDPRVQSIRQAFIGEFKKHDFDAGLLAGVRSINTEVSAARSENGGRLVAGTPAARPGAGAFPARRGNPQGGFGMSSLLGIGLLVVGGLFLVRLLGSLFGGNRGYAGGGPGRMGAPGYGGGGGGGGFMSGMFGGIGGALAGNWLYDQFSGRSHGGSVESSSTGGLGETGGDDWNSGSNASGDWGGGDAGGGVGGDWGGGGGGGGDWGGGGGGGGDW